MHRFHTLTLALLSPLLLAADAHAQLELNAPAPEIVLESWLNVPEGSPPAQNGLRGKVVMIEFWGTWCAPCLRAMPHVQELYEIYGEDGFQVLAIANEPAETLQPYLDKVSLTMPVGADADQVVHRAYHVGGWPTTVLIDHDGKVRYVGSPWDVEPALVQLLGVRNDVGKQLDTQLTHARAGAAEAEAKSVRRLTHSLVRAFDLSGWAAQRSRGATPADGLEELTAAQLLARCGELPAADVEAQRALLACIAARDERRFDLLSWARAQAAARDPLEQPEAAQMLEAARYPALLEALVYRAPTSEARTLAAADPGFIAWCLPAGRKLREDAKRGLLLERYVFAGIEPRDTQRYWVELGVAGLRADPGGQRGMGVAFGREHLSAETATSYVEDALRSSIAARTYASGRSIAPASVERTAAKERERLSRSLEGRYGKGSNGE